MLSIQILNQIVCNSDKNFFGGVDPDKLSRIASLSCNLIMVYPDSNKLHIWTLPCTQSKSN